MDIERETLDVDILVVGAGPAGLSFGYHLANLIKKSEGRVAMPEVAIADKGLYPGAHSLSGAVLNPRSLMELMPDYLEKDIPLEKKVQSDSLVCLTENSKFKLPFLPESLKNDGDFIISLNKFTSWLAEQVEAMEVNIFPETGACELIVENGRVTGVQTVDLGVDKEGKQRSNFEPGSIIRAKVTVLAEGVHGSLTKQAHSKLGIGSGKLPQSYLTGIKEVWEIPEGRLGDGEVIHTFGWPLPNEEYGGGFIYNMGGNLAAIGFAVGINSPNPANDPHFLMQKFKLHPEIKRIFEGGKMLHYGAKAIPEGGYFSMPKLYHDGLLVIGDSAGFLNSQKLEGIHLAIKSGMLAAETVFESLEKDDFSAATLKGMENRFENSWAKEELYKVRNFHAGFEDGLLMGLVYSGLQMITGGSGIFNRRETYPDYKHMMQVDQYVARKGTEAIENKLKFDNEYSFDKLTGVFRSGTKHEEDQPSHLVIADFDICNTKCTEEYGNPCQYFCPAQVYEMVDIENKNEDELNSKDESKPDQKKLQLTPSNCVHCKTCDIADPYQIITWVTPEGGGGPNYTNM